MLAARFDIEVNEVSEVQIHNGLIQTTQVGNDKLVTGPKGNAVTNDDNALFQVTASWQDFDGNDRSCILNVVPGESAVVHPDADNCDASIIDGKPQFPVNTEITFEETGATTDVSNVKWADVLGTVAEGSANITELDGSETGVVVELTGEANDPVRLALENKTSANGLIIIPIPIFPGDDPKDPQDPRDPNDPNEPNGPDPVDPNDPKDPQAPNGPNDPKDLSDPSDSPKSPGASGPGGGAGGSDPSSPSGASTSAKGGGLANTGASVLGIVGAGLALLLGGAWLALRGRGKLEA